MSLPLTRVLADATVVDDDGGCGPDCVPVPLYGSPPTPPPTLPADASVCAADVDAAPILAADFGQACDTASDCVAVGIGDPCFPCEIRCRNNAAIRKTAYDQWLMAFDQSPAARFTPACACGPQPNVCCNAGTCDTHCGPASDAGSGDASSDGGPATDAPAGDAGDAGSVDSG